MKINKRDARGKERVLSQDASENGVITNDKLTENRLLVITPTTA